MIDLTLRNRISSLKIQATDLFNDVADKRDDLPNGDKAQYRAVARQLEKAVVALEDALRKAKL